MFLFVIYFYTISILHIRVNPNLPFLPPLPPPRPLAFILPTHCPRSIHDPVSSCRLPRALGRLWQEENGAGSRALESMEQRRAAAWATPPKPIPVPLLRASLGRQERVAPIQDKGEKAQMQSQAKSTEVAASVSEENKFTAEASATG